MSIATIRLAESGQTNLPLGAQRTDEAVSLHDMAEQVRRSFDDHYGDGFEYWPIDVFAEFAVCRKAGKHYRVFYEFADGQVVFQGQLEEVEIEYQPVDSSTAESVTIVGKQQPKKNPPAKTDKTPSKTDNSVELPMLESIRDGEEGVPEIYGRLSEAADDEGWVWRVTVIESGRTVQHYLPSGQPFVRDYPLDVLRASLPLFQDVEVFAFSEKEHATNQAAKGVRDAVGYLKNAVVQGSAIVADLHLYGDAQWLRERLLKLKDSGDLERAGLSIDAIGKGEWVKESNLNIYRVTELTEVDSVDVVHSPAAGGRVDRLVASTTGGNLMNLEQILSLIESKRPDLLEGKDREKITLEEAEALLSEAVSPKPEADDDGDGGTEGATEGGRQQESTATPPSPPAAPITQEQLTETISQAVAAAQKPAQCAQLLESKLTEAALPSAITASIRRRFADKVFEAADLDSAIEDGKAMAGELVQEAAIPPTLGAGVAVTDDERDKVNLMVESLFWGGPMDHEHENYPESLKEARKSGFTPCRSILQAYRAYHRDPGAPPDMCFYESRWMLPPVDINVPGNERMVRSFYESAATVFGYDRARLSESIKSDSTWAQLLGDNVHRRMMAEYTLQEFNDWRKVASSIEGPMDFKTHRKGRLGGYGTLPSVAEQATYTSLTSPGDEEETYSLTKYGGLEDLTWETFRNDDVGAVRRIPVKMGRASGQTLYRNVFDRFEDNDSLVSDSTALVHADHNNDISGVLSNSTMTEAFRLLVDQTAYGDSTEILGVANAPRWLIHPTELCETAYQLTRPWRDGQGEHDTASRNTNFQATYGLEPLLVPYFAVSTDWWVCANPSNTPTIGVAFLDGREAPEIFVQDAPTVGSAFTADKVTYKIRHVHQTWIEDYRGIAGYIA